MKKHYLLAEVANLIGVKAFQVSYAIANHYLEEPATERINNKRIFTDEDIARIRKYFADKTAKSEQHRPGEEDHE